MSEDLTGSHQTGPALSWRLQALAALALALLAAGGVFLLVREPQSLKGADSEISSQSKRAQHFYHPTDAEWATLTVEPVQAAGVPHRARDRRQDRGRRGSLDADLLALCGTRDQAAGQARRQRHGAASRCSPSKPPTWCRRRTISSPPSRALNKARSQLNLAQIVEKRNKDLYEGKAVAAQGLAAGASRPDRGAERPALGRDRARGGAQPAAHPRQDRRRDRRVPGDRHDQRRDADLRADRRHDRAAQGRARPVRQRRRQRPGLRDRRPVDRLARRLCARDRGADACASARIVQFTVLAYPDHVFTAKINYVATALDPTTRRLLVRATIDNPDALLKPEMFANVSIFTDAGPRRHRGPARGAHLRRQRRARLGRARRQDDRAAPDQDRPDQRQHDPGPRGPASRRAA